jgi:hypothetical protein
MFSPINNNGRDFSFLPSNLEFYSTQLMLRYLLALNSDDLKKQSVTKLLTLFIWMGQSSILPSSDLRYLEEEIQELADTFHLHELPYQLFQLLNTFKSKNPKIAILEHLLDLEERGKVAHLEKAHELSLFAKFSLLAEGLKELNSKIRLMEVERELKDLKTAPYDHKKIDKKMEQLLLRLFP